MRCHCLVMLVMASILAALVGCGSSVQTTRKVTIPVKGQVLVDGQPPATPLKISCQNTDGIDANAPTVSQCFTDADGKFQISTYQSNDGVPPGNYALTFFWGQMNPLTMNFSGEDQLKNRYSDPKSSKSTFTVKEGTEPLDLGKIDLTTR